MASVNPNRGAPAVVTLREEEPGAETGGHFSAFTLPFDAAPGVITSTTFISPIPISTLQTSMQTTLVSAGDRVKLEVGPDSPIGGLESIVAAGATVLPMSVAMQMLASVGKIFKGMCIAFDDGTNRDELGLISSIDLNTNMITVTKATTRSWPIATLFLATVVMTLNPFTEVHWIELDNGAVDQTVGNSKFGASPLPAGTAIRISYDNKSASVVRVRPRFDILY